MASPLEGLLQEISIIVINYCARLQVIDKIDNAQHLLRSSSGTINIQGVATSSQSLICEEVTRQELSKAASAPQLGFKPM